MNNLEKLQKEEIRLIDHLTDEAERKGLSSYDSLPGYKDLLKLQKKLNEMERNYVARP